MPEQRQSPATEPERLSSWRRQEYSQTSEHRLLSRAISGERLSVRPILEIQLPLQFATANCKHTDMGCQIRMWKLWRVRKVESPASWPSPAGTPVGACRIGLSLMPVARVQSGWWQQHRWRGIGTHESIDLDGMNSYETTAPNWYTSISVTVPPSQPSSTVSLNDPLRTSAPGWYGNNYHKSYGITIVLII